IYPVMPVTSLKRRTSLKPGSGNKRIAQRIFAVFWDNVAERVGFEPTVPLPARRISSAVLSTTQPPLREDMTAVSGDCRSIEGGPLADGAGRHKLSACTGRDPT